jgi:hypothetical protein
MTDQIFSREELLGRENNSVKKFPKHFKLIDGAWRDGEPNASKKTQTGGREMEPMEKRQSSS